ncbi:hypothetical protein [Streptomyces rochei]|uniref:hypothetical protein n=1 Tax=Streptomyces rochei TaxID=1928 RepID=UPI003F4B63E3
MLAQTEATWREAGRRGPVIGVSSLQGEEVSFPNTTDVDELVEWTRDLDKVTVFATYASLGLGTLERAHKAGLPGWDLIVVDEAHRTSGRLGKPWAVVHDNTRVPALRRLYVTATPRLWQLGDDEAAGAPGELLASMDDDPAGPFGSRAYTLTLSEAIDRGICAPYQVVCVDITDTQLQAAQLLGAEARSDEVRGARLAALQTALLKASSEEGFRRTLVFHHMVKEAEAFAAGLPDVAAKLHAEDPELYPKTIWADWLCGDHKPLHQRQVLDEFAAGVATDGTVVEKGFLGLVKVFGEGIDTHNCDSVYFSDVRGSMPDLVQAVVPLPSRRTTVGRAASPAHTLRASVPGRAGTSMPRPHRRRRHGLARSPHRGQESVLACGTYRSAQRNHPVGAQVAPSLPLRRPSGATSARGRAASWWSAERDRRALTQRCGGLCLQAGAAAFPMGAAPVQVPPVRTRAGGTAPTTRLYTLPV